MHLVTLPMLVSFMLIVTLGQAGPLKGAVGHLITLLVQWDLSLYAVGQHAVACWTTAALGRWFLRYICCPTHHPLNPTSRVYLLVPWL